MTDIPQNFGGEESTNLAKGIFIVIEGTDGSGKSTQYQLLKEHLESMGHDIVPIHFPRYDQPSSYFIRQYLSGAYGMGDEINPYSGSIFYALDRYEASNEIRQALSEGKIVLCDRYVGSNMAHQGTKFDNPAERRGYFIWLDNLEFGTLGIPRPDINFVLNNPYDVITSRLKNKQESSTHIKKKDVHEVDPNHIKRSIDVYRDMCELFPKDFVRIDCARNDVVLPAEEVHSLLWEKITPRLPVINQPVPDNEDQDYITKNENGSFSITNAGKEFLNDAITNTDDNVYAFTGEKLTPITAAAAMARLSRRGDDMRVTILDEFAKNLGKDEGLLKRVITAYGDDSVQQLVGQHLVVEEASNLLTKKLEWGRLASYLEQSTRYIYFDQKDKNGRYKYFTPPELDELTKQVYEQTMDELFDNYSKLASDLTEYVRNKSTVAESERDIAWKGATRAQACDAIRAVLPVATKSTVGIYASGQALESLIMHLQADELAEARTTGDKILAESRKVLPAFLERADKPERGGANIAYKANTARKVKKLALDYLPNNNVGSNDDVVLTDYWPKNEFDLVADMLYDHSSLSLEDIRSEVSDWPYERKKEVFDAYVGERLNRRHKPGRALEKAHYSWDLVCDYGIFRDLQRHRIVDDLEWQLLTPRYGYEIPELVEKAGLSDLFEQCFDLSLKLYSDMQQAGYPLEAQYATLLGHKMRWKVTYNAREAFHLHELRTAPQGHPGYRKLVKQMHDKLCEVHPSIGVAMKFVNKDEDPELTRLAAERYTQFKLKDLQ
ncbi:MAG TPA: FAD-dependent thymidylate synthase [Candidatus Saccharibacteria bacterium]|nr:FAD-dependent thymidylate synthase [Candidatus Saccharibacteria bacterium]